MVNKESESLKKIQESGTEIVSQESSIEVPVKKPQNHLMTPNWQERFLEEYAKSGNKQYSASVANVSVRTIYNYMENDPDFLKEVEVAKQVAIQVLATEAHRRAMGQEILDENGNVVGRRNASDKLLIFLLSSMSPDEYGHGAIAASQRRSGEENVGAQIIVTLPENFRGTLTVDPSNSFPDADILDADFTDIPDEPILEIQGTLSDSAKEPIRDSSSAKEHIVDSNIEGDRTNIHKDTPVE